MASSRCRAWLPRTDAAISVLRFLRASTVAVDATVVPVTVTGEVPDVRPYLASAEVGVVPLRIARGIQNKLLEAMAMSLPVVATESAYEGVEALRGVDLLVADNVTNFAASVVRLLRDRDLRDRIAASARATVEQTYSWDDRLAELERIIEGVVRGKQRTMLPRASVA